MRLLIYILACLLFSSHALAATCPTTITDGTTVSCNPVVQYGITWTFSTDVTVGQFVTGDYFVVGSVTVASVSPAWDGSKNGSTLNPAAGLGTQGLDGRIGATVDEFSFDAALRTDVTNLSLIAGDSLLSTIGNTDGDPKNNSTVRWDGSSESYGFIDAAAILTVVATVPPAGTFRPAYVDRSHTLYNTTDVRYDLLPALSTTGVTLPDHSWGAADAYYSRAFQRPWLYHGPDFLGRQIHPQQNMLGYHENVGLQLGEGMVVLMSDLVSTDTINGFIQVGIDSYHIATAKSLDSAIFAQALVLAGVLLDDSDIYNFFTDNIDVSDSRAMEKFFFPSDRAIGTSECWTGWDYAANGYAECPMFSKQVGEEYEHLHPSAWTCYEPHCKGEVYRTQHDVYPQVSLVLGLILADVQSPVDVMSKMRTPSLLPYITRWMDEGFTTGEYLSTGRTYYEEFQYYKPTTIYSLNYQSGGTAFVDEMWVSYGGMGPATPLPGGRWSSGGTALLGTGTGVLQ
jgi:hypothetical protein